MNFLTVTLPVTCPVFNVSHPYKTTAFGHRLLSEAHLTRDVLTASITPKRRVYHSMDSVHHDILTLNRRHKA
jgi:hypothetical protein